MRFKEGRRRGSLRKRLEDGSRERKEEKNMGLQLTGWEGLASLSLARESRDQTHWSSIRKKAEDSFCGSPGRPLVV